MPEEAEELIEWIDWLGNVALVHGPPNERDWRTPASGAMRRASERCAEVAQGERVLGYLDSANTYEDMAAEISDLRATIWGAKRGDPLWYLS